MKKIVALALALVMVLGLMSGCEKKETMDIKTLAQKMDEAVESVTSVGGKMGMELELKIGISGMTMTMGVNMDLDMKYMQDMSAGYMGMTMEMEALGQNEKTKMETYFTTEGNDYITYIYEPTMDAWLKTVEDAGALKNQQMGLMSASVKFSEIPEEQMSLAKEQETVDGKSCYVLTVNLDGSSVQETMGLMMSTMGGEMDAQSQAMLEQMDWSALKLNAIYYVDAATFQTVKMTGTVEGMGEVYNSLFATMMEDNLMGADMGDMELSVEVPTFTISMSEMVYNDVEIPAIPQDAIDNAMDMDELGGIGDDFEDFEDYEEILDNPAQPDGSYKLSLEHEVVTIVVPEGYEVLVSQEDMVTAVMEDSMETVSYLLIPEYTDALMREELVSGMEILKEMELYASHAEHEKINGYSVMETVYTEGIHEWNAWIEISDGVLWVSVSTYDQQPNLEAVLSGIVIGE